jgi:hypothetical protein
LLLLLLLSLLLLLLLFRRGYAARQRVAAFADAGRGRA